MPHNATRNALDQLESAFAAFEAHAYRNISARVRRWARDNMIETREVARDDLAGHGGFDLDAARAFHAYLTARTTILNRTTWIEPNHATPDTRTAFLALPPFAQGYIECALWADANAECLSVEGDGGNEEDATLDDLSPELLSAMAHDCAVFEEDNQEVIAAAADTFGLRDREHLGHDFWLSRNGHGTGFWDRGMGDIGDRLHEAAQRCGSRDLYRGDDGLIHG